MTAVICIALILVAVTDTSVKGASNWLIFAVFGLRAVTILGLALLALLSTGWAP